MHMQVPEQMNELERDTIDRLQKLIHFNIDSAGAFTAAADALESPTVRARLRTIASERLAQAAELKRFVAASHETPADGGTFRGALRTSWMQLHAAVMSNDVAVLKDAERAEDHMKEAYEHAIIKTAGTPVSHTLREHYDRVKAQAAALHDIREVLA
jgi:uncharacterized protein (TIGR02284 family)